MEKRKSSLMTGLVRTAFIVALLVGKVDAEPATPAQPATETPSEATITLANNTDFKITFWVKRGSGKLSEEMISAQGFRELHCERCNPFEIYYSQYRNHRPVLRKLPPGGRYEFQYDESSRRLLLKELTR